jgi:hypothetical protein
MANEQTRHSCRAGNTLAPRKRRTIEDDEATEVGDKHEELISIHCPKSIMKATIERSCGVEMNRDTPCHLQVLQPPQQDPAAKLTW